MLERRRKLLREAQQDGYDALVACTPENLYYMTGFWGEAIGVLDEDGLTIVSPELEIPRIQKESYKCDVITADRGFGLVPKISTLLQEKKPCTDCRDYTTMLLLKQHIPNIEHQSRPFSATRIIKDKEEITVLKTASRIIDSLFELCADSITPGISEYELQSVLMSQAIEQGMFDTGYPSTLNPLIVAGGPNGALPHAQPTDRKFREGDLVVVDITLRHKGYVSDATRTFAVGTVSRDFLEIYDIVREAQRIGLQEAVAGVTCGDVDAACREYIQSKGYGDLFIHSTGHGIGLEVHEVPTISSGSDTILQKNMAVTIEPGIYMQSKAGVRIEDSIIIGKESDVMHHFTKDMIHV